MEKIGLIAGNGRFPVLFAQGARENNVQVVAVGVEGETNPEIKHYVESLHWIKLAQLGKLIRILKQEGITRAVMAGGLTKSSMYSRFRFLKFRPDWRGITLFYRKVRDRNDHTLLAAVAEELARDGIELLSSVTFVPQLLASKGCLTWRSPSQRETEDIEFGWPIAKEIAHRQIGQSVVVKEKVVLAVEAIEGTDEALRRGGKLGREGVVAIKVARENLDLRFDIPTVGPETVKTLKDAGVSCLAIEAGKTLVLDKGEMIRLADKEGISIIAL
ncbi:MAG: UDP-2,3-diacylglucosamine diphosphatase LpxI [Planctomycetes bacterium]|nr:UDP-2,3-diacylglucosamine diphosphatase LpxI [Planctomycetota bacterium]